MKNKKISKLWPPTPDMSVLATFEGISRIENRGENLPQKNTTTKNPRRPSMLRRAV